MAPCFIDLCYIIRTCRQIYYPSELLTSSLTSRPSARPVVFGVRTFITFPMSLADVAPTSAIV